MKKACLKKKKNKLRKENLKLSSLFEIKSYKSVRNKFNQILNEIKEFSEIIQSTVLDFLISYFKTHLIS